MSHIFISHVEEDRAAAEDIAACLRGEGFETWMYEVGSLPGSSYLAQVIEAIEHSSAVVVVISPTSMGSHQVSREVESAHQLDRPIIPVLKDVSHDRFQRRRPDWGFALGGTTSIELPAGGAEAIMPRIVAGLGALGITPGAGPAAAPTDGAAAPPAAGGSSRRMLLVVAVIVGLAVVAAVVVLAFVSSNDDGDGDSTGAADVAASDDSATEDPADATDAADEAADGPPVSATEMAATVSVTPTTANQFDDVEISYTITNNADRDISAEQRDIFVTIGPDPDSEEGTLLADLGQDIPAGETAEGAEPANLAGSGVGTLYLVLWTGTKVGSTTENSQILASTQIEVTV